MAEPSVQKVALACGAAGAYVDVSDDVITAGVSGSWGRSSDVDDTRPGVFAFDLDNSTGKYTPKNPSSSLATPVSVGMGAVHFVDGLKRSGTIRSVEPYWSSDPEPNGSYRVHVTCDDALGSLARTSLPDSVPNMVPPAGAYLWWPLDDPAGSPYARSLVDTVGPLVTTGDAQFVFGTTVAPYLSGSATWTSAVAGNVVLSNVSPIDYASGGDLGWWGDWIIPFSATNGGTLWGFTYGNFPRTSGFREFRFDMQDGAWVFTTGAGTATGPAVAFGTPTYVEVHVRQATSGGTTTMYVTPYVNGTALGAEIALGSYTGSAASNYQATPTIVYLSPSCYHANLSLTRLATGQEIAAATTEAQSLTALMRYAGKTLDTLPANLSTAAIAESIDGSTLLDSLNDVVRTEQGYLWTETTGTLTSPTAKVKVRARDRSRTVAYTFSMNDLSPTPAFTADIQKMVAASTARGPLTSQTAISTTLASIVGSAATSTDVLLRDPVDLLAWAQDRLNRGAIQTVRIASFTIDALRVNRWADIVAIRPGDRIRITDLPVQLGVTSIDGWVTGGSYNLDYPDSMLFTFTMQPALPDTGIYDTDVYDTGIYAF